MGEITVISKNSIYPWHRFNRVRFMRRRGVLKTRQMAEPEGAM
jgi:hypothetical protein